jgi:hypothetical protein
MRRFGLAIVLLAASVGAARAEGCDPTGLIRRAEAMVRSWIGGSPRDREVIVPPGDIDRQMALIPPPGGRLRIIPSPEGFRQR